MYKGQAGGGGQQIHGDVPRGPTLVNRWNDREALELVLGEMIDINNRIGNLKRKLAANKSKPGERGAPQPQQSGGKTKVRAKVRSATGEGEPSGAGSSKEGVERCRGSEERGGGARAPAGRGGRAAGECAATPSSLSTGLRRKLPGRARGDVAAE